MTQMLGILLVALALNVSDIGAEVMEQITTPSGLVLEGKITFYGAGVMEQVYKYRLGAGEVEPCMECVGMIAVLDAEHIGKHAYITLPNRTPFGPFLIVDCARQQDLAPLRQAGLIAEVSRERGYLWDMRGAIYGARIFIMTDHD